MITKKSRTQCVFDFINGIAHQFMKGQKSSNDKHKD